MVSADPKPRRDLAALREERDARHLRRWRRERVLSVAATVLVIAFFVWFVVVPMWGRVEATRRYEAAHAAVVALFEEDRAGFEALLVDGAPRDAYEAARAVVSIADPAYLTRGNVTDDAAGVVTAEGYEIFVPVTDELRVVPELELRPHRGSRIRHVDDDPVFRRSRAAVQAVFGGDREAFEVLLLDGSPPDVWERSLAAIEGLDTGARLSPSGAFGFEGETFDRKLTSYSPRNGVFLLVQMQRVGNRWFVDGPVTRRD